MAMRMQATSQDPDVEASRAELAALEGHKNAAQDAVLIIAADHKRLLKEIEESRNRLEREMTLRREVHAHELDVMDQKHRNIEMAVTTMESVQQMTKEETAQFEKEHIAAKDILAGIQPLIAADRTELSRLGGLKHNLEDAVADYKRDLKDLQQKIAPLEKSLGEIDQKIKERKDEYDRVSSSIPALVERHGKLTTEVSILQGTKGVLEKSVEGTIKKSVEARAEFADVQNQITHHRQMWAGKESDINERMGNIARLEAHVDEKLQLFKQGKDHFTTEQLLMMGIRD